MAQAPATSIDEPKAIREGIVTGLLGAAIVALFYFIFDMTRNTPFLTPSVLGQVFVLRDPGAVSTGIETKAVVVYTIAHIVAFQFFGITLALLARRGESSSMARYAILPVFLAFMIFFFGVLAVADEATRGLFPLWTVLTSNLLAAGAMGYWIWRRHPRFREAIDRTPLGASEI